jgi:hypothetical protein
MSSSPKDQSKRTPEKSGEVHVVVEHITEEMVISQVEKEREELSDIEKQHLHSFSGTDTDNALNAKIYAESRNFTRLTLSFNNLRARSKAFLTLRDDQHAIFSEGNNSMQLSGLSLSTAKDTALNLDSFLVNARELYLKTFDSCQQINVQIYVLTDQPYVKGRVDLPSGASLTLQSPNDRTSLIGLSSFALDL